MSPFSGAGLNNPEGLQLARELLHPQIPHDVRDYVLEGICKAIDVTMEVDRDRVGMERTEEKGY
ncbi:hypothetical protein BDZ97DRAFT_1784057 [Flammula alnicola]|nr:hypothetical protein BDZ97DRAFT_1876047 [Flammula alnicola]KAF8953152.1 hypothetical protein BDZ97DRAFT_1873802 [Flammula alnicola]KAF8972289.1 hypothetical protein BDZ97DRAFT_1784057 [Flammula alnicola]